GVVIKDADTEVYQVGPLVRGPAVVHEKPAHTALFLAPRLESLALLVREPRGVDVLDEALALELGVYPRTYATGVGNHTPLGQHIGRLGRGLSLGLALGWGLGLAVVAHSSLVDN